MWCGHYQSITVITENVQSLPKHGMFCQKKKNIKLSPKMLWVFGPMYIQTNESLTLTSVWSTFCKNVFLKIQYEN